MKTLIIATRTKKKQKELKKLLKGLPLEILGLNQLNRKAPRIKEDKNTFVGNAKKKAFVISKLCKDSLVIADDSGLVVDCLKGAPGIKSARYAGASQNDNKNIAKLLKNMGRVNANRKAYFNCTAAIAKNGKVVGTVVGKVHGRIAKQRYGSNGFGYDPVFVPKGYKKTFAQMNPTLKNRISHRAKALRKAKLVIQKYLRWHP